MPDWIETHYHPTVRKEEGMLMVGKGCKIHRTVRFDLTGNIWIGDYTMLGEGVRIYTHYHDHPRGPPLLTLPKDSIVHALNKYIGSDVWLYDDVWVLAQVQEIPDGVIVGARSVLTHTPGPYEIWTGNPARKVGERS